MAARLGEKRNWSESNDLDPLVPDRFSPGFYRALSRVVHAELRVLRGARALGTLVCQPLTLDRNRVRRAAELRHVAPWLLDRLRLEAERRRSSRHRSQPAQPAP
jgi:hypothetical protein